MKSEEFAGRMMELFPQIVKAFSRYETHDLASGKITLPQFWALYYLSLGEKCKMKALAEHLGVSPAAATGLIDRLISQGLVVRKNDLKDRRVVWIGLSAKGSEMICRIKKQRVKAISEIFGKLSSEDRKNYLRILEEVCRLSAPGVR
jgi:MarR family transcriptional regulator, organic hydroperoxide resistance regulator